MSDPQLDWSHAEVKNGKLTAPDANGRLPQLPARVRPK